MTKEIMQQALDALETVTDYTPFASSQCTAAINALREAIAQPVDPKLPVVGYYGVNHRGYESISLKENHLLRDFEAGEITAQPVCLISDAIEAIAAIAQPVQPAQELVYQYQMANGQWIDQTEESYHYNVKHRPAVVRVLYAEPVLQTEREHVQPVQPAVQAERGWMPMSDGSVFGLKMILMWNAKANAKHQAGTHRIGNPLLENTSDCTHWMPLPDAPSSSNIAQPIQPELENDVERLRWLSANPVEAIDIFGYTKPNALRCLRLSIDAAIAAVKKVVTP